MSATPDTDPVDALVLDLLEWIGPGARPYADVLEAWRTSCPRLPVWEKAGATGFVMREYRDGEPVARVSATGLAHLAARRRATRARCERVG